MHRILVSIICLSLPLLCPSADTKHDPPTYQQSSIDACINDLAIWSVDHRQRPDYKTCAVAHTIVDACAEDSTDSQSTHKECLIN